ncbi:Hypothetical_protein [Hexamita inflata]|uniref:Hypothetical_protein n=1 Tax=Hexamita inflata TaxID=28002 RepID=A0AA86URE2_9EUKA|nr:Hypothetical protein HINF_LOCUS49261 [Hexamita inflata]
MLRFEIFNVTSDINGFKFYEYREVVLIRLNPSYQNSSFSSNTRFSRNLEYVFPQIFLNVVEELTGARMNSIYGALTFQVQRENKFFWKLVQKSISEYTEAQLKTYYYKQCELQTKGTIE